MDLCSRAKTCQKNRYDLLKNCCVIAYRSPELNFNYRKKNNLIQTLSF